MILQLQQMLKYKHNTSIKTEMQHSNNVTTDWYDVSMSFLGLHNLRCEIHCYAKREMTSLF